MRLENEVVRVEFGAETGGLTSIYDRVNGWEYIGAPDRALLFRLMTPEGDANGDRAYTHLDAASPSFEQLSPTSGVIRFMLAGAEAEVRAALDGPALELSLKLTNYGVRNVEEVIFPWVRGLAPMNDATIVWPCFFQRKIEDVFGKGLGGDHHTWNRWTQKSVVRYPAHLASAWMDYGNGNRGLGMEGRHTDFSIMDFYADKAVEKRCDPVRRTLDLATVQPRRVLPNETAEFAPVRIVVHEGDWHATADAHREWLETWVTKPDRPDRFAKSIGWHFFFMKHQDGWERQAYDDLPQLADAALEAGCDYMLLFGWQEGGHDNNYMYRYVPNEAWGGAEALRLAIAECRERGVEIMPFYNGTLANIELEEHKAFGHRWEAKTRAGHPYYAGDWARHNYDAPTRNRAMLHHEIAPCAEHRAYFLETMRRMIEEYGFGNTQLDQIAEKMFVDYCEDHIETRPDRVFVDGLAAILSDVRRMIRAQNPEGVMISESLNDFTGQWCDSSWDWNILLPFPEPILYSLPWLMASHEIDADEYAESNTAFAYKMHFDMKIDGGDSPITRYPEFAAHVRALSVLRKATANYVALARFRDEENLHISDAPPNVVAKSYHDPQQNRAGVVLAETSGIAARVRLKIAWRSADDAVPVLSSAGTREMVELEGAEGRCLLTLAPYEVKIVCIDLL